MGAADFDPFAELDALRTERNSAVAEAKLWLRRVLHANKERDQAKSNFYAANKCVDEWIAAYDALLRQHRRLEVQLVHEGWDRDYWKSLAEIYEPHAKRDIQRMIDEAPG